MPGRASLPSTDAHFGPQSSTLLMLERAAAGEARRRIELLLDELATNSRSGA
jgi:hypothetical protein